MNIDTLATNVGLSRNAVWRRVRQMKEAGVIRATVALLDAGRLGLGLTVFIAVRTAKHDAYFIRSFSSATQSMPEIQGVYRMSGDLDYLIRARVADVAAYDKLYQRLTSKVALSDVSASFVMEEIKDTTALPIS